MLCGKAPHTGRGLGCSWGAARWQSTGQGLGLSPQHFMVGVCGKKLRAEQNNAELSHKELREQPNHRLARLLAETGKEKAR